VSATVALAYRPPYDFDAVLAHLAARAVEGVERVDGATWRRGPVAVTHDPAAARLIVELDATDAQARDALLGRVRRLFDLDADPIAIGAHLARDPLLAPLVAARPGLRVPGGWDGFEIAVRAILGQQISVAAARRLLGRLVALCGTAPELPDAAAVARADLSSLGVPGARRRALHDVAAAALAEPTLFEARPTIEETVARLRALRGVGEWTAQYIALRGARHPDAFPASDLGLLRGAAAPDGTRPTAAALLRRAEAWRPWRAYAAQHLWTADATRGPAIIARDGEADPDRRRGGAVRAREERGPRRTGRGRAGDPPRGRRR